jgi:hypothetical protein
MEQDLNALTQHWYDRGLSRCPRERHMMYSSRAASSERVNLSVGNRDQHRASFETAASRLPQDEVFLFLNSIRMYLVS